MKRLFISAGILLTLSRCGDAYTQADYFLQYNQALEGLNPEKVYLHTDRNIYSVKEDIWFKIYLVNGISHAPVTDENTVYVDLTDLSGKTLIHKPFYINNGTGHGSFTIGDSLETGSYSLYAYTNYMKNFGIESFFRKDIIINRIILSAGRQVPTEGRKPSPEHKPSVSLQFMPEGGYLSDDLDNNLAFKITSPDGRGLNLGGVIKDQNGQVIDSFRCSHLGMGKMNLTVSSGMKYYGILNDLPSDTFFLPLSQKRPQLQYMGILSNNVCFKLTDMSSDPDTKQYYFVVKAKGQINFYVKKNLTAIPAVLQIPMGKFRPGLNQALLLDSGFRPLAERLFFIPGIPVAEVSVQLSEKVRQPREKTEISLQLTEGEDARSGGSFSISVLNLDQIGSGNMPEENILSFLELTSEIRGYIEDPGYYFSSPFGTIREELDLLLLTQGWTKYLWDDAYLASLPPFMFRKESGLSIAGQAEKLMFGKALQQGNIILLIPENNLIAETSTDSTGYFRFDHLILFDSTKITVQSKAKSNWQSTRLVRANSIITAPPLFPESDTLTLNPADAEAYMINAIPRYVSNSYFNFDKSSKLIPELTITEKRRKEDDGHFRPYSAANNVIDMDEYEPLAYRDIFSLLFLVPGVYVQGDEVYIRRSSRMPLLLLDGIEIDIERFRTIPVHEIDKIEVLKDASNTAIYGVRGGNGVIAVYTRRGEIDYFNPPILFDIIARSVEGYAKDREFYVPDYDDPETNKNIIDNRATVFWKPDVIPDSTGICTISFFNSDDTGRIAVIAEGILNNGKPGVARAFYQVLRR